MPSTILDDVLIALEETAAESKPERAALLVSAHNMLVRQGPRLAPFDPESGRIFECEIDNQEDPEE